MGRILLSIALLAGLSDLAFGQTSPASEIAPAGKLRVGMIVITVLGGVAEPVAAYVGRKLGAAVEPVMYPNPKAYLQSFGKGEWDIAIGRRVLAPTDKADLDGEPLGHQSRLRRRARNRISRYRLRGQGRCEDWHHPRCSLRPRC